MTKQTLIIEQQHLKEVTAKLGAVIKGSKVLPILDHVHLSVKKSKAVFTGTDLSVTIQCTVQVTCEEDFDCLVPFSPLKSVAGIAAGTIAIVKEEKSLKIIHANDELRLSAEDVADYPKVPQISKDVTAEFSDVLSRSIQRATLSVGKDDRNPSWMQVCLDFKKNTLNVVSTDGFTIFKQTLPSNADFTGQLLIPVTACNSLGDEALSISHNDKHVAFSGKDMRVIATLFDGKYPNYNAAISKPEFNLTVGRAELYNAVMICALSDNSLTEIALGKSEFTMRSKFLNASDYAKATITADYAGECKSIGVKSDQMLRVLKQIGECEELDISIISESKIITLQRKGDSSTQCVVMPVIIS